MNQYDPIRSPWRTPCEDENSVHSLGLMHTKHSVGCPHTHCAYWRRCRLCSARTDAMCCQSIVLHALFVSRPMLIPSVHFSILLPNAAIVGSTFSWTAMLNCSSIILRSTLHTDRIALTTVRQETLPGAMRRIPYVGCTIGTIGAGHSTFWRDAIPWAVCSANNHRLSSNAGRTHILIAHGLTDRRCVKPDAPGEDEFHLDSRMASSTASFVAARLLRRTSEANRCDAHCGWRS